VGQDGEGAYLHMKEETFKEAFVGIVKTVRRLIARYKAKAQYWSFIVSSKCIRRVK
jgi:hypothetical protein